MMGKLVWISWEPGCESSVKNLRDIVTKLGSLGLEAQGVPLPRSGNLETWSSVEKAIEENKGIAAWLVLAQPGHLQEEYYRYHLSATSTVLGQGIVGSIPVMLLNMGQGQLPVLPNQTFGTAVVADFHDGRWSSDLLKLIYQAGTSNPSAERYLRIHSDSIAGQWLELGPLSEDWHGVLVGVTEKAEITHHAVGSRGLIPERCILEYPIQGMKLQAGQEEFSAWAVRNTIGLTDSYFLRIDGIIDAVLLANYPTAESSDMEVSRIELV